MSRSSVRFGSSAPSNFTKSTTFSTHLKCCFKFQNSPEQTLWSVVCRSPKDFVYNSLHLAL